MSTIGLTSAEAARRLAERGEREPISSSRSYRSIVRENTLTLFNLILGAFGVALIVTGQFADMVFVLIIAVNAGIGIVQEVRAKRQLDELALLVAPVARVLRDGTEHRLGVEEVVPGDAIRLGPGEAVVADGTVLEARGLQLDESVLTGEADAVGRRAGEQVRSGTFCVAGAAVYEAEAVGEDAYASQLTTTAREDRQPLSPLQLDINRLLRVLVGVMIPLGAAFVVALHLHHTPVRVAVSEATAGIVSLVPEGLVLLASITFAVAAGRMARHGALVQRLNVVESLAGIDVVCVDKTGTLTDGALSLDEVVPLAGLEQEAASDMLARYAASLAARNATVDAVAASLPGTASSAAVEVPFSSRWKWSGLAFSGGEALVLGAPDVLADASALGPSVREQIERRARERKRVLLFARARGPLAEPDPEGSPLLPPLEPIALAVLSERMRDEAVDTVAFLQREGISVKVISGDGPTTVEAVALAAGLDARGRVVTGSELPADSAELAQVADRAVVFARIAPDDKRRIVEALRSLGRRVAMIGDGVNDVPALKQSDVAVALGSGSQIAKGVADLVLVGLSFGVIPGAVREGRKILANIHRVAKLFVTKSVFAAVLILTVGLGGGTYPFLPRQLSLAAAFTVGIPAFALALAPPGIDSKRGSFLRDVASFAIPAGLVTGAAVLLGHGLVHSSLGRSAAESQTTSVSILTFVGLYIVLVLESSSMRRSAQRARGVQTLCAALAVAYIAVLLWPPARDFFSLAAPSALPIFVTVLATTFAVGALGAMGLSLTRPGGEHPELVRFWTR
jgi:cation-transporting ATPase E